MELIKAKDNDFEKIRDFYWTLIDAMQSAEYKPGWEKGVYPEDAYLMRSISDGNLFYSVQDGRIIGAMVVNNSCSDGYDRLEWSVDVSADEVSVIHALGVMPDCHGKGAAKFLVREALRIASERSCKTVRLDVLNGNIPALRLYESVGFRYVGTVKLYYEDTGLVDFLLYEYVF